MLALTSHDCNGPLRRFVRRLTEENATRSLRRDGSVRSQPARAADRTAHGRPLPRLVTRRSKIASSGVSTGTGQFETLHLMNPDGSGIVDLGTFGECTTWSTNGSKLMYCAHPGDGNWAVWVINADGTDRRQLTHPTLIRPAGAYGDEPLPLVPPFGRTPPNSVHTPRLYVGEPSTGSPSRLFRSYRLNEPRGRGWSLYGAP